MDATPARSVRIDFSASGSEYFRIWIVNLLLTVLTLGLYLPFAKARRLRYFYANTAVGGQALAFHGDPWKMLRGYLLMLLLFGSYAASGHVSSWLSLAVFALLALLWPALWRSSLRFRLGNTSWRGLRFAFEGGLKEAYAAMGLVFVPGLVLVLGTALAMEGINPDDKAAMEAAGQALLPWMAASLLLSLLLLPYAFWLIKRYQHNGYRYAAQATQFSAGLGSVLKWGLKVLGVSLLAIVAFALVLVGLAFALGVPGGLLKSPVIAVLFVLLYVAMLSLIGAYAAASLQNLIWNATRAQALAFDSQLKVGALTRLTLKNLLLTALTLGLYRPFAVVNTLRLKLDAVTLTFDEPPSQWRAGAGANPGSASGEMSGDFFGIDLGL